MTGKTPRLRGRPRSFDTAALVRQVQSMFWHSGYEATSLGEIVARTGVHKPSLYAAFKDKRGLFTETLNLYFRDTRALMDGAMAAKTLRGTAEMFLNADVDVFSSERGAGGCYFICIFNEAARDDPVLGRIAQDVWAQLRERIDRRVEAAPTSELPPGWSRGGTSDLFLSSHVYLAVRGRAGATRKEMRGYATRVVGQFPDT